MKEHIHINEIKGWYLKKFEDITNNLKGNGKLPFSQIRKDAIARFMELGFPTTKWEDWKYTNISPILKHQYSLEKNSSMVSLQDIKRFIPKKYSENIIVFINGEYAADLSSIKLNKEGLLITNLKEALYAHWEDVHQYISKYANFSHEPFTALNTALAQQGVFIKIPADLELKNPIHLLYLSDTEDTPFQSHPRNLIIMGKRSQAKIFETHHYLSDGNYLNNAVTEIFMNDDTILDHIILQNDSRKSYRISKTQIYQKSRSFFSTISFDLGGAIVRNNLGVSIDGENSEANLYGFYLINGRQHVDNYTRIDHLKPYCNSNELYKGILSDRSSSVFSGSIYVAKDAQKTNAFQSNKNLLLSEEAEVNSKPQLKIFADDVKCSHGATIGQLDEEALFYLKQRGIAELDAQAMLRSAFAGDVLERISLKPLKDHIEGILDTRLKEEF